jgi:hypothetical protein
MAVALIGEYILAVVILDASISFIHWISASSSDDDDNGLFLPSAEESRCTHACGFVVLATIVTYAGACILMIGYPTRTACGVTSIAVDAVVATALMTAAVFAALAATSPRFSEARDTGGVLTASAMTFYAAYLFFDGMTVQPVGWNTCMVQNRPVIVTVIGVVVTAICLASMATKSAKPSCRSDVARYHVAMIAIAAFAHSLATGWKPYVVVHIPGGEAIVVQTRPHMVIAISESIASVGSLAIYIVYLVSPMLFPDRDYKD